MENSNPGNIRNSSIVIPEPGFEFDKIHLADPIAIQGGSYFTKISTQTRPLYIQTPKCMTKQGFTKSGKKIHNDLVFNTIDEVFIQWLIDLESACEELIYQKSSEWFQNPLEYDDIQSAFNSCVKIQKTGNYIVRSNVKLNSLTHEPLIRIYNESEHMLTMEDVIPDTNMISILEVKGVKFTTRSFQLDIEMKQVMVLNKDLFENCLIKPSQHEYLPDVDTMKNTPNEDDAINLGKIDTSEYENTLDNDADELVVENIQVVGDATTIDDQTMDLGDYTNTEEGGDDSDENSSSDDDSVVKLTLGEMVRLDEIDSIDGDNIASANILSDEALNLVGPYDPPQSTGSFLASTSTTIVDGLESKTVPDTESGLSKEKELVESILDDIKPLAIDELNEVRIEDTVDDTDIMKLKKPSEYYYELYKQVRETARQQKQTALESYMKAKDIKNTYMLDDVSDTSDDIQNIGSDTDEEDEEDEGIELE